MHLNHLHLQGFRNLQAQKIEFLSGLNFFYGPNGAGKTSLLEAVHVLASGKSFRNGQLRHCVQQGHAGFLLQAGWTGTDGKSNKAGVQWEKGQWQRRFNAVTQEHHLRIARQLPCIALHPGTQQLIAGGPEGRRKLFNWLMFHVEPDFMPIWKRFSTAKSHRNVLLRQQRKGWELDEWTRQYLQVAEQLHAVQKRVFQSFAGHLQNLLKQHPHLASVDIQFYPGWSKQEGLQACLQRSLARDLEQGHTQCGPHRMDLRLRIDNQDAREWLSRGQQKLMAYELVLAAIRDLSDELDQWPVLLLDDMQAELDEGNLQYLLQPIQQSGAQVLANGLEPGLLKHLWSDVALFHVKQGLIQRQDKH